MWETWVWSLGWEHPWRRKWQPIPVLLSGKSHGWRSLVDYSPWGPKSDTTERLHFMSNVTLSWGMLVVVLGLFLFVMRKLGLYGSSVIFCTILLWRWNCLKKTKVLKKQVESFVTFLKAQRDWYVENKRHNALVLKKKSWQNQWKHNVSSKNGLSIKGVKEILGKFW